MDLGSTMNVTGIATQGRSHSREFVIEFRIQYGANGRDWIDYKEARVIDTFCIILSFNNLYKLRLTGRRSSSKATRMGITS